MNDLPAVRTCGHLGSLLVKVYLGRDTTELRGDQAVWEHTCERPWRLGLQTDFMGGEESFTHARVGQGGVGTRAKPLASRE